MAKLGRAGLVCAALLPAACNQLTWSHPAGPASFDRDALECDKAGVHASGNDPDMMAALNVECMEARGWTLDLTRANSGAATSVSKAP
jgi:hypothetical protein